MIDSCGGIQTRLVTINNYTWKIDVVLFEKLSCNKAEGFVQVSDSKGNISTVSGIPGFMYGVVRAVGDTIWSTNATFTFNLAGRNTFEIVVKDACGKIKKAPVTVSFKPTVGASVNTYSFTCNKFSAAVTNIANFFNPRFCLFGSNGLQITCNTTGVFANLNYGSYCIKAHDSCSDTTIVRCFNGSAPPISVSNTVTVFNKTCIVFSAAVAGQVGLTTPQYCLYDSVNNLIGCNDTGIFDNLSYGSYCIRVKDDCRDTIIIRCFTARRPTPALALFIPPGNLGCTSFSIIASGDSLTRPRFCIFDSTGTLIACNSTGVFDSLGYGSYCVSVYDSCYDTTIIKCISSFAPGLINTLKADLSNKLCKTFTATISGSNLVTPNFCLYTSDSLLIACDSTGIFNNLAYGFYYVKARNSCPDTTFTYNFSASPPLPSLDANVTASNKTCASFSVNVTGQQNFTNPNYCLYNNANVKISCNTTGTFTNLAYGSYCINIKDGCYDTTISRCFSVATNPVFVKVNSRKSCNYGFAKLGISISGGVLPVNVKVLKANGDLFFAGSYSTSNINIDSVPGNIIGEKYKIIVTDNCGNTDSAFVTAVASSFKHVPVVIPKCPSSTWLNGSGSIKTTASSNTGTLTVSIIKKNNSNLSPFISPSLVSAGVYTFNNLGPAKYVIRYKANDACNKYFYDTVTVSNYQYPNLDRSSAYQCDQNGFSIGAVVSNGVGPFTYEIIGSTPASPSIINAPQPSPLFNINNGTTYSLIRLRALDACGNASLEDASILPLANNGITADFNCFQLYSNLRVDTLYNSVYAWYLKHTISGSDSIYLGSTYNLYMPNLTPSDTGLYTCHLSVNSGCIKRTYYYRLTGACSHYLPVTLQNFTGRYTGTKVLLNWQVASNDNIKKFTVERKGHNNSFAEIGSINVTVNSSGQMGYQFLDPLPDPEKNYYRLKLVNYNNTFIYSNEILLTQKQQLKGIVTYPNPVNDLLTIEFKQQQANHSFKISLVNLQNQVVKEMGYNSSTGNKLQIRWSKELAAGTYILKVFDVTTNEGFSQKVVFQ